MRITYQGPFDEVQIAATGQIAEQGKPIEVDDDIAENLVEQDCWKKSTSKPKKE